MSAALKATYVSTGVAACHSYIELPTAGSGTKIGTKTILENLKETGLDRTADAAVVHEKHGGFASASDPGIVMIHDSAIEDGRPGAGTIVFGT